MNHPLELVDRVFSITPAINFGGQLTHALHHDGGQPLSNVKVTELGQQKHIFTKLPHFKILLGIPISTLQCQCQMDWPLLVVCSIPFCA